MKTLRTVVFQSVIFLALAAPGLHAGLLGVNIFANTYFFQTSSAAPTSPAGYFFDMGGTFANPGDFDSASATYPGPGSPQALAIDNINLTFGYGSPADPSLSSFQSNYPYGTYTITASNSSTSASQTGNISYLADYYTSDIPALTATTFNSLPMTNGGSPITIAFNSFTPNPNTTAAAAGTFFTIWDSTNTVVYSASLSPSDTSLVVPGGTLLPGGAYTWELDFSSRLEGTDAVNNIPTLQGFDLRTDGSFTTAVPEPAAILLAAFGLGLTLLVRRRRA